MTVEEYKELKSRNEIQIKRLQGEIALARAKTEIPPENELRRATPDDIEDGTIMYHRHAIGDRPRWFWAIVDMQCSPSAYMSTIGTRHSIEDAYVRKEKK